MCLGVERQKGQVCFPRQGRGPGTDLVSDPTIYVCCPLQVSHSWILGKLPGVLTQTPEGTIRHSFLVNLGHSFQGWLEFLR